MLTNCDNVKAILTPYLPGIEFNLAPQKELYYNEKNERNMTIVVMIEVDATKVDEARDKLTSAWMDPDFLNTLGNVASITNDIDYIHPIKCGVMTVGTYHAALKKQHAMNLNTIGVTITGVDDMATNIPINSSTKNETTTLQDMIIDHLKETDGKGFFSRIKPTKHSEDEGCYILITRMTCLDEAEKAFDKMIKTLEYRNKTIYITKTQMKICHVNHVASKSVAAYAESLTARLALMASILVPTDPKDAPTPCCPAWKRTPTMKFGEDNLTQADFPPLSPKRAHGLTEQCQSAGEASQATALTTNTDE